MHTNTHMYICMAANSIIVVLMIIIIMVIECTWGLIKDITTLEALVYQSTEN